MQWARKAVSVVLLLPLSACLATIAPRVAAQEAGAGAPGRVAFHTDTLVVEYDTRTGLIDLLWKDGHRMVNIASAVELADGTRISTETYSKHEIVAEHAIDKSKTPATRVIRFRNSAPGVATLVQHLWLYPGKSWVVMDAELEADDKLVGTRHFDTLVVNGKDIVAAPQNAALRVLHVPFDNDMWFRWKSISLSEMKTGDRYTSQEVTTLYDNDSRQGIVIGSVAHDTWKTAIDFTSNKRELETLDVYGGISSPSGERSDTHDFLPHGIVSGHHVTSPRVFLGSFSDWRDGMEAFGRFNAEVNPPLRWPEGSPMGWNSWAAYADKIDEKRYLGAAKFVHDELLPEGFGRKVIYINLDAFWSRLDSVQLSDAVANIRSLSAKDGVKFEPGIYWTPFAYWSDDLDAYVEGTNMKYRYRDILLKGPAGVPLPKVDGGRAIDPTHPGALARIDYYVSHLQQLGFQYLKLDFLTHGILEGEHYDKSIQTGVQAYNMGMRELVRINHDKMFLSLSIAPLFPSGYGHARRLSCDTKGHINGENQSTEYMLNALTYGWWTDKNLFIADPDHVVLGTKADEGARSVTEGRSRLLSAVITGGMILDSSRLADDQEGQQLAKDVYRDKNYLRVASEEQVFRPIEGDTGDKATAAFVRTSKEGFYVAVFNFDDKHTQTIRVPLNRIAPLLTSKSLKAIEDISSGENLPIVGETLEIKLNPSESKLLSLGQSR